MADYISREAAVRALCDGCVDDGYCGDNDLQGRYACEDVPKILNIPPADVIPRATIEENIENVIGFLNTINADGRFDYPTYSALHDVITGILPEKEADSDG